MSDDSEIGNSHVSSAISSLKELLTIISGLAATNAVLQLMVSTQIASAGSGDFSITRLQLGPGLLCAVNILLVARFYHGNYRHLDEEYSGGGGKAFTRPSLISVSARVASDFVVILVEAIILTFSSFLFPHPFQYCSLVASLLILDAVWFFFAHRTVPANGAQATAKTDAVKRHSNPFSDAAFDTAADSKSKAWALNNIAFGIVFLMLATTIHTRAAETSVYFLGIFSALALINCAIDIVSQFTFYFPTVEPGRQVFLGAPFTDRLDSTTKEWKDFTLRELIVGIHDDLTMLGFKVYSAHLIEQWGKKIRSPARALREDLAALSMSEVVICLIDEKWSPGVQMELGAAAATKKKIIQVSHLATDWPYLNGGLSDAFRYVRDVRYENASDCISAVRDEVVNARPPRESVRRRLRRRFGNGTRNGSAYPPVDLAMKPSRNTGGS